MSERTPMRSSPQVVECARRCVDFVEHYPNIMDWIKYHQIDMFMSVMIGRSTDLELRERFFRLPPEQRPDSYMKSLLEHATEQDAEQLMALFITAFQGNISLTLG
eukprot:gene5586-64044_t